MSVTAPARNDASTASVVLPNLPLRQRPIDIVFIVVFSWMIVSCFISDLLPTVGVDFSQPSDNFFVNSNYWYASDADDARDDDVDDPPAPDDAPAGRGGDCGFRGHFSCPFCR